MPETQDYFEALEAQRNNALNEVVNLKAELAALRREVDARSTCIVCEGENGKVYRLGDGEFLAADANGYINQRFSTEEAAVRFLDKRAGKAAGSVVAG